VGKGMTDAGTGRRQDRWKKVQDVMGTSLWVQGGDGHKKLSPCHSLNKAC